MHDSHIHLALEPLKSNVEEIIQEFVSDNGKYILTQGTDIIDFEDTLKIAKDHGKTIQVALGLHPTFFEEQTINRGVFKNLTEKTQKYLDKFENILSKNIDKISAIGETGLDYYQNTFDKSIDQNLIEEIKEIQKISFKKHIQLAIQHKLPLSIHARDIASSNECVKDTLKIVAEEGRGLLTGSFHSYTGDIAYINNILDLGFNIGFNAIITYKNGENVRDILREVPLERILFETDGPFLPPQSVRKNKKITEKFAKPSHVREIITVAAEIKDVTPKYLEDITDENYKKTFFNL